jgi:hypothetical protein
VRGAFKRGTITPDEARQIRAQYGGKLTMIDKWLANVLDALEPYRDDTAVIVTTDHGHYLGEKDTWGKPPAPAFETMSHIPLMIRWPGAEPRTVDALTTSVDLSATIADVFDASFRHRTHGRSIVPLINGDVTGVRDWALCGVWGREVNLIWDNRKYARAPEGSNSPLSLWSNRWSTMPVWQFHDLKLPPPDDRAVLDKMPGSKVPVIRQPFVDGDMLPYWAAGHFDGNHLYDLSNDPEEDENLAGSKHEKTAKDLLHDALKDVEAPSDQFERLAL